MGRPKPTSAPPPPPPPPPPSLLASYKTSVQTEINKYQGVDTTTKNGLKTLFSQNPPISRYEGALSDYLDVQLRLQTHKSFLQDLEADEAVLSPLKAFRDSWSYYGHPQYPDPFVPMQNSFVNLAQALTAAAQCRAGEFQLRSLFPIKHNFLRVGVAVEMSQSMRYDGIAHWILDVERYTSLLNQVIAETGAQFRSLAPEWWNKFETKLANSPVAWMCKWNPWDADTLEPNQISGWLTALHSPPPSIALSIEKPNNFLADLGPAPHPEAENAAAAVFSLTELVSVANYVRRQLDDLWDLEAEQSANQMKLKYHPDSLKNRSLDKLEQEFVKMLQISEQALRKNLRAIQAEPQTQINKTESDFYKSKTSDLDEKKEALRLVLTNLKDKHMILMQAVITGLYKPSSSAWWQDWIHPQTEIDALLIPLESSLQNRPDIYTYYPALSFIKGAFPPYIDTNSPIYTVSINKGPSMPYNPKAPPKALKQIDASTKFDFNTSMPYSTMLLELKAAVGAASMALQELQRRGEEKQRLPATGTASPLDAILATIQNMETTFHEIQQQQAPPTTEEPSDSILVVDANDYVLWPSTVIEEPFESDIYQGNEYPSHPWVWYKPLIHLEIFETKLTQLPYGLSFTELQQKFDQLLMVAEIIDRASLDQFMNGAKARIRLPIPNPSILTPYGWKRKTIGNEHQDELTGVDIQVPTDALVCAVMSGRVIRVYRSIENDSIVIINHGVDLEDNTLYSLYHYIGDLKVKAGEMVELGQAIGSAAGLDDEGRRFIYHELQLVPAGGDAPKDPQFLIESPAQSLNPQDYVWPSVLIEQTPVMPTPAVPETIPVPEKPIEQVPVKETPQPEKTEPPAGKRIIYLVAYDVKGRLWKITREDKSGNLVTYSVKTKAVAEAIRLAKQDWKTKQPSQVKIYKKNGIFQTEYFYGDDPIVYQVAYDSKNRLWKITREDKSGDIRTYPNKKKAVAEAVRLAKQDWKTKQASQVNIYKKNGTFQTEYHYGYDQK